MDPRAVPVIGTGAHLPPLPADWLLADTLRSRLKSAHVIAPECSSDGGDFFPDASRTASAAAVLIPLVARADGFRVLLTRRADHLRDHAGQISFPGGRRESGDSDAVATALREAQEEIGLAPSRVEVVGVLADYLTVTRYVVTPVIGLIDLLPTLTPDPVEVAEIFEVPLQFLMSPVNHRSHSVSPSGQGRQFLSMPWVSPEGREFYIWGATAAILRNLYRALGGSPHSSAPIG